MIKTSKKLLPELRFPEFSNQWVEEKTSYFLKRVSNPVNVLPDKEYQEIGVRSHGKGIFHKKIIKGKDLGDKRVFWVEVPAFLVNIVFAWEQAVAVTSIAEKGFIASHRFPMFVPNNQRSDLNFVKYFFFRPRGKFLLGIASPGGAGRNKTLGQNDFAKLKVIFPKIEEQQKIAAFLSAVDDKLTNLIRKSELLESYKRGLMQQLFSQQIRFKQDDGSDYPDWQENYIGQIGETFNGLTGKTAEDFGSGKPYVTYKQVFDSSFIKVDKCQLVKINAKENQTKLYRGDILFTTSSETPNEVGFASVLFEQVDELYLNSFCFCLRPYPQSHLLPEFSQYLFRSHKFRRNIYPLAQGSTRYNLSKKSFKKLSLDLPAPEEQQKIANFLQSIDNKINAVAKQITQLDTFKKGLLQKMFV